MKASSRLQTLDALRGAAVLLVLGRHLPAVHERTPHLLKEVLDAWQFCGWMGVDLFFVLSGFLVSGLIFREFSARSDFDAKRFLIRRGFKIYPAYYLLLVVAVAWVVANRQDYSGKSLIAMCTFTQNYYQGHYPFGHTWSLAVEEHFYVLLAAITALLCKRNRIGLIVPIGIAGVLGSLFCRLGCVSKIGDVSYLETLMKQTHMRLDGLCIGMIFAFIYHKHPLLVKNFCDKRRRALLLMSTAAVTPCAIWGYNNGFSFTVGLTIMYLGWTCLLMLALTQWSENNWLIRNLARVGFYSYSIYVWHLFIRRFCDVLQAHTGFGSGWESSFGAISLYAILSVVAGVLMAKLIELPMLALRERMVPQSENIELTTEYEKLAEAKELQLI